MRPRLRHWCALLLACALPDALLASTRVLDLDSARFANWAPAGGDADYGALGVTQDRRVALIELGAETTEAFKEYALHLHADGGVTERVRIATLFLNDSGAERRGNSIVSVDAWRQKTTITNAYVLSPDGERHEVDPRTVQVVTADTDDIFSDVQEVVIPWPRLRPGAVSVLEYETVTRGDRMTLPWSRLYFPQHTEGVERLSLEIRWDSDDRAPAWDSDLGTLRCSESRRRLSCEAGPLDPVPGDPDVYYLDLIPSIVVARRASWAELSGRVARFVREAQTGGEEIRRTAEELTADAEGQPEKLARLHAFASRQVRYVGMEHGRGDYVPRPTSRTLANRYGDCKDKTVLFLDLARAVGIDAHAVLTSIHFRADKLSVPAAGYFDHMIACGRLDDGADFCVDLTDRYTGADTTPAALQGIAALRIGEPDAAPALLPAQRHRWHLEVESEASFDASGDVVEEQRRIYRGAYAAFVRAGLADMAVADREAEARARFEAAVGSPEALSISFEGLNDQQAPVVIASESRWRGMIVPHEPSAYVDPSPWLNRLVGDFASENIRYAYDFPGVSYRGRHRYLARDGIVPTRLGPTLEYESEFGSMRREYSVAEGAIEILTRVELPSRVVGQAELEAFNRFLELIVDQSHLEFDFQYRLATP